MLVGVNHAIEALDKAALLLNGDAEVVLVGTEIEEGAEKLDLDDLEGCNVLVDTRKTERDCRRLWIDLCVTVTTVQHNDTGDGGFGGSCLGKVTGWICERAGANGSEIRILELERNGWEIWAGCGAELEIRCELSVVRLVSSCGGY